MYRFFQSLIPAIILLLSIGCNQSAGVPPAAETAAPAPASTTSGDPQAGQALFNGDVELDVDYFVACKTCHYTEADRGVLIGPNLAGVARRAETRVEGQSAIEYLHRSIIAHDEYVVDGFAPGLMLSIAGQDFGAILSPEQIDNLVAYLMTLEEETAAGDDPQPVPSATPRVGIALAADANGYVNLSGQYALRPAAGWQTQAFSNTLVLQPADADPRSGPLVLARMGEVALLNIPNIRVAPITSTEQFFNTMLNNFEREMVAITLHDAQNIDIGGIPARVADFRGSGFGDVEGEVAGRLAIALIDETHSLVMIGLASPPDGWQPHAAAFDSMLQSLRADDATGQNSAPALAPQQTMPVHYALDGSPVQPDTAMTLHHHSTSGHTTGPALLAPDHNKGPRFACVSCHVTHDVEMLHDSNPSCDTCHSGTSYQRHCVDCHSIHDVDIPHKPNNPGCASCHSQGIPGAGVDVQEIALLFLTYLFHEI